MKNNPKLDEFCDKMQNRKINNLEFLNSIEENGKKIDYVLTNLSRPKRITNLSEHIYQRLNVPKSQHMTVLSGGGIDANFLFLLLKRKGHNNLAIISGLTKSNELELTKLSKMCEDLDCEYHQIEPRPEDLLGQIEKFTENVGREPRDVAQPIMNYLCEYARHKSPETILIDGQFADTNLFANPQNLYWKLTRPFGFVASIRFLKFIYNIKSKFLQRILASFLDSNMKVMFLCSLEATDEIFQNLVSHRDSLKNNDEELIFQLYFRYVLLHNRELDKYKLIKNYISPFDDENLFIEMYHSHSLFELIFKKKWMIKDYIREYFPMYLRYSKSRSFEAR